MRIRHYGLLTNRNRKTRLKAIMENMGLQSHPEALEASPEIQHLLSYGSSVLKCPTCKTGTLELIGVVFPGARGDPTNQITHIIQKNQAM
ncbi:MAG: hypothetical protein JJU02_08865 [Cryomorphaceae bacterium]|nr:hypothetical protein [Cryomorphaceae bacterium]